MSYDTFVGLAADQSIAGTTWDSGDITWSANSWLVGDGSNGLKASATIPGAILANYTAPAGQIGQGFFFKPKAGRDPNEYVAVLIIDATGAGDQYTSSAGVRAAVGAYGQLFIRDLATGTEASVACTLTDGNEYFIKLEKTTDASGKQYRATVYNASGGVPGSQICTQVVMVGTALTGRLVQLAVGYPSRNYVTVTRVESVDAAAADTTAPTITAAAVANSTPTVVALTASEALDSGFVPAASAFTVSGHTVSAVAISGSTINLTVTPAFVNGEAARTVAYTQPGTNNVRDAAGNLLANFTGQAITNNVQPAGDTTPPTFVSAQVANASPTVIQVTMSETLANSVPATTAFTVSGGRTVSSVSIAGAVVSITVNTAYSNGDVITVAYTQPGANPRLQDAAGNATATFAAQSVANNIASATSGLLTTDALTTSGTLRPSGTAVYYSLLRGGQIGVGVGTATHGSTTLNSSSKLSLTGLTAGAYLVWMRFDDGGVAYQEITVS